MMEKETDGEKVKKKECGSGGEERRGRARTLTSKERMASVERKGKE